MLTLGGASHMSKKYIIPLMLVIITSGLVSLMAQGDLSKEEAKKLYEQAQQLYKDKKYDDAINNYKKIYEAYSKTEMGVNCAYNIACDYSLLDKKSDALDWLEKAIGAGVATKTGGAVFTTSALMREDEDLANIRN